MFEPFTYLSKLHLPAKNLESVGATPEQYARSLGDAKTLLGLLKFGRVFDGVELEGVVELCGESFENRRSRKLVRDEENNRLDRDLAAGSVSRVPCAPACVLVVESHTVGMPSPTLRVSLASSADDLIRLL